MNTVVGHDIRLPILIEDIMEYLPHRYPFALVDRITELEVNKRIVAYKNISINEPFFQGHFPGHPVMPGVLIIEAMAQASGLLCMISSSMSRDKFMHYFASIDNVKFKQPVIPGDRLEMESKLIRSVRNIAKFAVVATVAGNLVCSAELMLARREV